MEDIDLLRYSRHLLLPEINLSGQKRLQESCVLIAGLGGLGSPVALYLAAAGVGNLLICDFDTVDLSNLQRQILHNSEAIGQTKVNSAYQQLHLLNPTITITPLQHVLTVEMLNKHLTSVDLVLDCTDNLTTRLIINQACVQTRTPLISGAAIRMEGQLAVFPNQQPTEACYQCAYSPQQSTETCTQTGILAPIVGVIGSMQAVEAIKLLVKNRADWKEKLFLFDGLAMEWYEMQLTKNPHCPICHLPFSRSD